MRDAFPRRTLAALAVAVYALVVGLLLPLHLLEEAPGGEAVAGLVVAADCQDRDCGAPDHHHGERGHCHDPATCVKCSQAASAGSVAPAKAVTLPVPAFVRPLAPVAASAADPLRAVPPARGPPASA